MTYIEAAQSAINCQNACNASGLLRSLGTDVISAIWDQAQKHGLGTRWVNRHPVIALYMFKIGELNGFGVSSLDRGYDVAFRLCRNITEGLPEPDYNGNVCNW
jgi:hypothetical protein